MASKKSNKSKVMSVVTAALGGHTSADDVEQAIAATGSKVVTEQIRTADETRRTLKSASDFLPKWAKRKANLPKTIERVDRMLKSYQTIASQILNSKSKAQQSVCIAKGKDMVSAYSDKIGSSEVAVISAKMHKIEKDKSRDLAMLEVLKTDLDAKVYASLVHTMKVYYASKIEELRVVQIVENALISAGEIKDVEASVVESVLNDEIDAYNGQSQARVAQTS